MARKSLFTGYEILHAPKNKDEKNMTNREPNYRFFHFDYNGKSLHIIRVKNTPAGRKLIESWRKAVRGTGVRITPRGRDNDRKALFAKTGRTYCLYSANGNDIYFNTPEGKLCQEFMVYVYVPKGVTLSKEINFTK